MVARKLWYVVEKDTPNFPMRKSSNEERFPWFTHDILEAQFFAWTLNNAHPRLNFIVKGFTGISSEDEE